MLCLSRHNLIVVICCNELPRYEITKLESRISAICTFAHSCINYVTSLYTAHLKLVDMFTHIHTNETERELTFLIYFLCSFH